MGEMGAAAVSCAALSDAVASRPTFWHWLLFIVVVGLILLFAVPMILTWQRRQGHAVFRVDLSNVGNVRSRYALRASEPSGQLTFRFLSHGRPLREQAVALASTPPAAPSGASRAAPAAPRARAKPAGGGGVSGLGQTGGLVASLLTTLASIAPGSSVGKSLTRTAASLRRGQTMASQAQRASEYAGQLGGGGGGSRAGSSRPADGASPVQAAQRATPAPSTGPAEIEIWAQTPFVEPGQTLSIDMHVRAQNPYRSQQYGVHLASKTVEVSTPTPHVEQIGVHLEGLNAFERYAPFILLASLLIVLLMAFLSLW